MKKLKHVKIKNSAILYELLIRQISTDVISGKENSNALRIVKEYFGSKSEVAKELVLYKTLSTTKFNSESKAQSLVEAVLSARKKLDASKLRRMKYQIIKEVQRHYNVNDFFSNEIPSYKLYASIYMLFEDMSTSDTSSPMDIARYRNTLVEHIVTTKKSSMKTRPRVLVEYEKQPEDVRLLTTKFLLQKFNDKYKNLTLEQRQLVKEYINNVSHSLKKYVDSKIPSIKKELAILARDVDDRVTKIKLVEVVKQLDRFSKKRDLKDTHVIALLNYYSLIKELKVVQSEKKDG